MNSQKPLEDAKHQIAQSIAEGKYDHLGYRRDFLKALLNLGKFDLIEHELQLPEQIRTGRQKMLGWIEDGEYDDLGERSKLKLWLLEGLFDDLISDTIKD